MPEPAKNILTSFLRRLTNLSGNNRSLLLLRLSQDQFIDVQSLSYLNGHNAFEIVKALVKSSPYKLCAVHDSRFEANNVSSQKLKMLQRIDRFVFEEKGTNDLHVGWPFVRGKFNDGTLVRCPLLYFPVRLTQQGQNWILEPRTDAGITFNKAFILAYAFYHKVKLDEELLEFSFDDFDKDLQVFRTQLYQLLQNRIELNFNTENFSDELKPFTCFKRTEFEETYNTGQLKLFPEAVLGMFPQAGSHLVPDYIHLLENENFGDLEQFFEKQIALEDAGVTGVSNSDAAAPVKEEKLFTPFALDAFQEQAIHIIKRGGSIVVQGPPGTGKSQLICNLLADSMAAGKKVLLVCQKRAALDVVYERLDQVGMASFAALVHDFRNDRRDIFDKIAKQIENIEDYKSRNRHVDVIQNERRFVQICRSIDHVTEALGEFKEALLSETECGMSVKQLYLTSDPSAPSINLKQEYPSFTFPIDAFVKKLKRFSQYAALFERRDYPWLERKSFAHFQASDELFIENTINDILDYQKNIATQIYRVTGTEWNLDEAESFWYRHEEVLGMVSLLKDEETYRYFQRICEEGDETSLLWLSNLERVALNCFDDIGLEVTIPTEKLGKFQEALNERVKMRSNIFRAIRWELFSENKFLLKRVLVANELAYNKFGLRVLEQRIDSRLNLEHHFTSIKSRPWLLDLPQDYKKENLQRWFTSQKLAIRAKAIFQSLREIKDSINPSKIGRAEFFSLMRHLLDVVKGIPSKKEEWQAYLSAFHIKKVVLDPNGADALKQALREDFDNLCEFDKLKLNLSTVEEHVIRKIFDHTGSWDGDRMEVLFQNSLRLAWIDHIEVKYPVLRSVSSMRMDELQQELHSLVSEKEKLSLEILAVRARENAYENLTYNRLNNLVTYRDLQHQVTKKKKVWPLRRLITSFHDELFQLIPCWMASPESVSAIFPMQQLFDLVIFDEASQCFSERGIPAMYRGKQVLVAGDGQQLRPSELYQVRYTDEETESPDIEVESLLELAERYLPTVHLQGHYRSKSLELIHFSNMHFYGHRLKLLPDRIRMNSDLPAIDYVKVDGEWKNQTNEVEAKAVAEKVLDILLSDPAKEIGIVTFNAPQQNLILDVMEEEAAKREIALPASLFVKNIENVQGDEKDIIIFSVAYAPDRNGKLAMMFGSLGIAGGENRLNVAVTRAREKIIVVTSIFPEQLNTEGSANPGPKLLQQYLAFARHVSQGKFRLQENKNSDVHGDVRLTSRLKQWGEERIGSYDLKEQVMPYADIAIVKDDKHLGIVLTDDDRFIRSISIKEAFAYTPALLKKKNWPYRFVYSRQAWKDLHQLEQKLMVFIGSQNN